MTSTLIVCSETGAVGGDNRSWAEVLVTTNGEVVQNKNKFVLTRADLETCAAQIRANADKLPLDYDHSYVENGNTVASGWFTGEAKVLAAGDLRPNDTTATEDELWAEVEWTQQAADDIRAKRYRFISAEFRFAEQVKGVAQKVKEFFAATLTNRPFFNRMEAVTLSRITTAVVWDTTAGYQHIREKLSAALNPPQADGDSSYRYGICDIDLGAMKALVEDYDEATTYIVPFTLSADGEPTPADQSDWVAAEQQWVSAAKAAASTYTGREATTEGAEMDTTVLAKSLGLADDATEEQITTKLAEVNAQAAKADELATEVETLKGEKTAEKSEIETLREQVETERKARLEGEREQVLTAAISEGRMAPAEKDILVEAFGENVDGLRKVLAARPKNVIAKAQGSGEDGDESKVTAAEAKRFENADGDPIDDESLKVHARALEILGDKSYTEDEYLAAASKATDELHVTA